MNKGESKRTKDLPCLFPLLITRSISPLPFFFAFFILHHSSLILFSSPFLFGIKRPARFATWGRSCPIGQTNTSPFYLLLSSPLATGHSHLALPLGESLHGGDSQAQMFVGSGYSSLPSSSRANLYFLMEQLGDVPGSMPGGMTELVE